jgi:hypothetical protein
MPDSDYLARPGPGTDQRERARHVRADMEVGP